MRFGKGSDTAGCRSFFALQTHHSPWKTKAINLGVRGRALMKPLGFRYALSFAHRILAADDDGVGVVDYAVTDGIG